jgi:hypothetical protein
MYLRKRQVAARYGVHPRTVDRGVATGVIRRPDMYLNKLPLWDDEKLAADERRAARHPSKPISKETAQS